MICSNRGLGADGGGAAYESHRLLRLCRRRGEPVVDLDEDVVDAMRHGMMQGFLDTVCIFGGLYGLSGYQNCICELGSYGVSANRSIVNRMESFSITPTSH